MTTQIRRVPARRDPERSRLDRRLDDLGWALLFLLTGGLLLVPDGRVPQGTWLAGFGLLLLALNLVRYGQGIAVRKLTTLLGALALAAGLGELAGAELPLIPLMLVAIGGGILLRLLLRRGT